jgi:hypothetical protein
LKTGKSKPRRHVQFTAMLFQSPLEVKYDLAVMEGETSLDYRVLHKYDYYYR